MQRDASRATNSSRSDPRLRRRTAGRACSAVLKAMRSHFAGQLFRFASMQIRCMACRNSHPDRSVRPGQHPICSRTAIFLTARAEPLPAAAGQRPLYRGDCRAYPRYYRAAARSHRRCTCVNPQRVAGCVTADHRGKRTHDRQVVPHRCPCGPRERTRHRPSVVDHWAVRLDDTSTRFVTGRRSQRRRGSGAPEFRARTILPGA